MMRMFDTSLTLQAVGVVSFCDKNVDIILQQSVTIFL